MPTKAAAYRFIDEDYGGKTRYGSASSPVMAGDTVVVVQEREFRNQGGGFDRFNRLFEGRMEEVLGELVEGVWSA